MIATLYEKVKFINPAIAFFDANRPEKDVSGSFDDRRSVMMLLLAAFTGLALFLSAFGILRCVCLRRLAAHKGSRRCVRGAIGA